ncbi:DUF2235 domain-containing protein [Dongia sedimenti]|uniref:DUF2235 domain-containing protein n=1 Tax=Dongia sedimenti TaxID=3064282 RepID=A0ABU0YR52_9PROT|nr:DUF2235 domain-containing protein [Rhodospirillaceae bacterium R-7]
MPDIGAPRTLSDLRADWRVTPTDGGNADPLRSIRPPAVPPTKLRGKAIIICCDGTSNDRKQMEEDRPAATNVFRLYDALTEDSLFGTVQITWYDEGVGTGTSSASKKANLLTSFFSKVVSILPSFVPDLGQKFTSLLEMGTGIWIEENIAEGYREIVRHYEPGDQIFIFGFSRGAYTARCIAGVIERCGLLKSENIRFAKDAITLYRRRKPEKEAARKERDKIPLLKDTLIHPPASVRIEVLGIWDTVASLGLPLWGWWFRVGAFWRNQSLDSNPAKICKRVYHALSMDEQRSQFFPTMTSSRWTGPEQVIRQVWFRGVHADIGGGYGNRSLGDLSLEWMLQIAHHHGLKLRDDKAGITLERGLPVCRGAAPLGKMHDEIKSKPGWIVFGAWPRWVPVPRPEWTERKQRQMVRKFGAPHDAVYRRSQQAFALWQQRDAGQRRIVDSLLARDGLIFLNFNNPIAIPITAATVWNRTGIVFEFGSIYKITYVEGEWQDKEKPECGPAGQKPQGLDLIRRLFTLGKRLNGADWLELVGHIAHPRPWPAAEFGLRRLLTLFFVREPRPLARSLIRMGRHLGKKQKSVTVVNLAHNGVFHAFGNDTWTTYPNNSGRVVLEIERVSALPPADGGPCFVVTPRGEVIDRGTVSAADAELLGLVEERSALLEGKAMPPWPAPASAEQASENTMPSDYPTIVAFADVLIEQPLAEPAAQAAKKPSQAVAPNDGIRDLDAIDDDIQMHLTKLAQPSKPKDAKAGGVAGSIRAISRRIRFRRRPSNPWRLEWTHDEI